MQIHNYRFQPKLKPTIATLLVLPLLISLGLWQSGKADQKQIMQDLYDKKENAVVIHVGSEELDVKSVRYSKIETHGYYEPEYQILIDNQVYKGQAGYHVVTPLHIAGSEIRILVNRGWIPLGVDRNILPTINTPKNEVEVVGLVQLPSSKYIELSNQTTSKLDWQLVWQNLDIDRYKKVVTFKIQPAVLLLDPVSAAGGYVRDWPKPNLGIDVNRGYAIQWYLMALALIVIYFSTNIKKIH